MENTKQQELQELNYKDKSIDLVKTILNKAGKKGATSCEVAFSLNYGLSTTVRLQEVDTIEFNRDKSIGISVYKGKRKGNVIISDITAKSIDDAIDAALKIAKYTEEDDCNGLADPELMAKNIQDLKLYHYKNITPEQAINFAKECEKNALNFDKRITNSEGATFSNSTKYRIYANSHGFIGDYASTSYSMSCVTIAKEKEDMHRDYDYTIARDFNDLTPFEIIGKNASKNALARLGARKISTTKAPVIFSSKLAPSLFGCFVSAISGGNLYRKNSFLLDSLNKKIFPKFMHIKEDPFIPKEFGSCAFDAEGVATYPHDLVADGIVKSYILSSYSARKLGMKTTANAGGVHNLLIANHNIDFADLLKKMDKGLLITELMGHGVNIVTGDFSKGAFGFWVENGEIQYPVHEITIAGNLKDMFKNIISIANDIEKRTNIKSGSVLLEEMIIAGN